MSSTTTTEQGATASGPVWHTLSVSDALQHEEVDPTKGLSAAPIHRPGQSTGRFSQGDATNWPRRYLYEFDDH